MKLFDFLVLYLWIVVAASPVYCVIIFFAMGVAFRKGWKSGEAPAERRGFRPASVHKLILRLEEMGR